MAISLINLIVSSINGRALVRKSSYQDEEKRSKLHTKVHHTLGDGETFYPTLPLKSLK
jgi:hypothetical protein